MLFYKMVDNNAWALFIIIIIIIIIVSQHAPNCLRNRYGTFDCVWGGGGNKQLHCHNDRSSMTACSSRTVKH